MYSNVVDFWYLLWSTWVGIIAASSWWSCCRAAAVPIPAAGRRDQGRAAQERHRSLQRARLAGLLLPALHAGGRAGHQSRHRRHRHHLRQRLEPTERPAGNFILVIMMAMVPGTGVVMILTYYWDLFGVVCLVPRYRYLLHISLGSWSLGSNISGAYDLWLTAY